MTATRTTYWAKFASYLEGLDSPLRVGRYLPANRTHAVEIKHPAGLRRDGAHLAATALHRESVIRANVVLEDDDSLTLFEALRTMDDALDVGGALRFEGARNPRVRRIYVELAASYRCERDRTRQFEWLRERLERLHAVFYPLVH